jgi:hypothetical protein
MPDTKWDHMAGLRAYLWLFAPEFFRRDMKD